MQHHITASEAERRAIIELQRLRLPVGNYEPLRADKPDSAQHRHSGRHGRGKASGRGSGKRSGKSKGK